jgi:hypothetical protein
MDNVTFINAASGECVVSAEELNDFKNAMRGEVLCADDPGYGKKRAIWNGMIDRRPSLIACCSGTADVAAAVKFARKHDLSFSVKGGGHHVTGRAVCDRGLMIDLSNMRQVFVDAENKTAIVSGGATLGDIDHETQLYGLAAPLGVVSETGVAGLTLHGGYGHLSRRFGMASDNVIGAEVVTADGKVVWTDASHNEDLFWALRGGGGNFGVVTSFKFRLHQVGPKVWLLFSIYPAASGPQGLRLLREQIDKMPEEMMVIVIFWNAPDVDFIPEEHRGKPVFIFLGNYSGPLEDGQKVLEPFRTMGTPIADLSGPLPFEEVQRLLDPDFPDGRKYYWKSAYLNELDDRAIDILAAKAAQRPSPISSLDVWTLGGQINRVDPTGTAFPQRKAKYMIGIESNWDHPEESEANIAWARDVHKSVMNGHKGMYLNFPGFGEEGQDILRNSYGPNYDRLKKVKAKWDPSNFFKGVIEL